MAIGNRKIFNGLTITTTLADNITTISETMGADEVSFLPKTLKPFFVERIIVSGGLQGSGKAHPFHHGYVSIKFYDLAGNAIPIGSGTTGAGATVFDTVQISNKASGDLYKPMVLNLDNVAKIEVRSIGLEFSDTGVGANLKAYLNFAIVYRENE